MKECYGVLMRELSKSGWPSGKIQGIEIDEAKRRSTNPRSMKRHPSFNLRAQTTRSAYGGYVESFTSDLAKVRFLYRLF